jgi:hypothetical protein
MFPAAMPTDLSSNVSAAVRVRTCVPADHATADNAVRVASEGCAPMVLKETVCAAEPSKFVPDAAPEPELLNVTAFGVVCVGALLTLTHAEELKFQQ